MLRKGLKAFISAFKAFVGIAFSQGKDDLGQLCNNLEYMILKYLL